MIGRLCAVGLALGLVAGACSDSTRDDATTNSSDTTMDAATSTTAPTSAPSAPTSVTTPDEVDGVRPRPDWLGTRPLPVTDAGFGAVLPTPPELVNRRFATVDVLAPPPSEEFTVTVDAVPDDVLARSTWTEGCPVGRDDLCYVTLSFWGFDGRVHTGELLVNADAVDAVTAGFGVLFDDGFPIEEMRVTRSDELDLAPTGDGNNTSAFVCRPSRGATSWSQHAYGRAVDINPFHNPYVKGDLVLPELASAYVDRGNVRPGMLDAHAVRGFLDAGWGWGGTWTSLVDIMHVSATGS